MKKTIFRISKMVASLALVITAINVNSTCMYLIHQPELPKGAEKLSKIK